MPEIVLVCQESFIYHKKVMKKPLNVKKNIIISSSPHTSLVP